MPVEIGPDGTPIITETIIEIDDKGKVGEPFIVTIPKDAVTADKLKQEPTGMANKIKEAETFNSKLNAPEVPVVQVEQVQTINKDVELMSILKMYGMDSQQQGKAFTEIKKLFES